MKRTITALTAIVIAIALTGCATAKADVSDDLRDCFASVQDKVDMARNAAHFREVLQAHYDEKQRIEREAAERTAAEAAAAEEYYEPVYYSEPVSYMGNPDGLNNFDGTYDFNGKHETFYGNSAVYDDQLWVDDEGFWRTDDGHYVVASVDYAEGTEIDMSKGKAIVMDGGCEPGTVDVHVSGWN